MTTTQTDRTTDTYTTEQWAEVLPDGTEWTHAETREDLIESMTQGRALIRELHVDMREHGHEPTTVIPPIGPMIRREVTAITTVTTTTTEPNPLADTEASDG